MTPQVMVGFCSARKRPGIVKQLILTIYMTSVKVKRGAIPPRSRAYTVSCPRALPMPDQIEPIDKIGQLVPRYLLRLRHQDALGNAAQVRIVSQQH